MVTIKGIDNQSLQFGIAGYESPDESAYNEADKWLMIRIKVDCKFGKWESTDPSLLLKDMVTLTKWMHDIANGRDVDKRLEFLEPNLVFENLGKENDHFMLRIHFDYESKPKEVPHDEDYYMDSTFTAEEMKDIVNKLLSELEQFTTTK